METKKPSRHKLSYTIGQVKCMCPVYVSMSGPGAVVPVVIVIAVVAVLVKY